MSNTEEEKTHFGYERVTKSEKTEKVKEVFDSVSNNYDLMNDLMSFGLHRIWKKRAINLCNIHSGQTVLDLAGGTGDLTKIILDKNNNSEFNNPVKVILSDINENMLNEGKNKLIDAGHIKNIEYVVANAEELPFEDNSFERVIIGFGLRNVTQKEKALKEIYRVLKPAGKLVILEFSKANKIIKPIYDIYSFKALPVLGKIICNDDESYKYLAESIRMHPSQKELKEMLESTGFELCNWHNLCAGIVAIHTGVKA